MTTTQAATEAAAAQTPGDGVEREFTVQARSQRQQIVRRFLRNKVGMTGLVVFLLLLAFGFLGPLVYGTSYATQNSGAQSVSPGAAGYPLGSDAIGRDLLAGLMIGVQRSLFIVLLFIVIALPLGLLVGALAGYFGRWVDSVLMRLVDLILTVPLLVVLIVVASNFGDARTPLGVGIILGLFGWLDLARIVRSQFLSLREKEYVEAAHALGASNSADHLQAPDPQRPGLADRLDDAGRGHRDHPRGLADLPGLRRRTTRAPRRWAGWSPTACRRPRPGRGCSTSRASPC